MMTKFLVVEELTSVSSASNLHTMSKNQFRNIDEFQLPKNIF